MSDFRKVITKPGELIGFETVFEENPYIRTGVPAKKGTIERVDYTTDVYEDGKTYQKYCYVYLPWGYDSEDKSKKYNVLYYQHGNTCEPSIFSIGGNKPMLDMLFDSGELDPCIIVSTTYYFDPMGDAEERMKSGMVPAGDGGWEGIKGNFWKEVIENIIPAVETRYNTWLEDRSAEAIKASRDHRAFSGYSRGAVMTWRMLHYGFEYFKYFAPMSCMTRADKKRGETLTKAEVIDFVTAPIKAHPELPFFIFASNGGKEDIQEMNVQMNYLTKEPCFSYGPDPEKNNIFYAVSDLYHTDFLVPYYYWNSLKVLFK
ncbi:MAG: hypothetical protein IJL98_08225 [Lachnospiraceae bacterium]|nr:hypothetical protein [Lachnospiraceae bacterium]